MTYNEYCGAQQISLFWYLCWDKQVLLLLDQSAGHAYLCLSIADM